MELQVQNPPEVKQGLGTWKAFLTVITSPGKTFAQLIETPRTWLPSLYLMLIAAAFSLPFIGKFQDYARAIFDKTYAAAPPTAGISVDQMKQLSVSFTAASMLLGIIIGTFISPIIYAAILKLLNFVMGEEAKFKQLWTITVFAQVPVVIGLLLNNLLLLSASGDNLLLTYTTGISLGALVPKSAVSLYVLQVLSSLRLFSIWGMILTIIGTATAFRSKALRVGIVVFGVWLVFILLTSLLAQNQLKLLLG